ncbi:HAD family hydrolase [Geminicoccus roseus]|uniref:HAD family hydrolase n=1 Tax=Geminicoccus roseus TaxID=404900 RepID=UPI0004079E8E|nr:HAD family hydrolase [Geminicoccus roseus]
MTSSSRSDASGGRAIDLLICDVDGTLVDSEKQVAPATARAVRRLRAAGIGFTIISARPTRGLRYPVEVLEIDQPTAAFNGGTIAGADGTIIQAHQLANEVADETLALLCRHDVEIWLFADDEWRVLDPDGPFVPRERRAVGFEPVVVPSFGQARRVDKIVAASDDHAMLQRMEGSVGAALEDRARAVRSQPYYLDVTALRADKGHGVAALAEAAGIPLERVAVIGDGHNDVAMFRRAGLSIAMGQAAEDVRAAADHVTASNDEDGVAEAIERFILASH